ncbi:Short-chain dehydrogenase [Bryocella elongata]|uniref:Short-chain dehydrogenase n=1 Tax=Bryocella elongata TaxID=863522 RepID=A0A1H5T3N3_9BACT|nr:SDR family oxidoreductase [Bryocella elongata]SEF57522.1 Short-chain dehydrogenase [Bryocella elongata]
MDLKLAGSHGIVTGGTAGIGLAIARQLAAEGVDVVITGRSESVHTVAAQLQAEMPNAKVTGVIADVGSAAGVEALFRAVPQTDILINNLGIYEAKKFEDIPDADWLNLFEVNVLSGVRTARHYLPGMIQRDNGRIIFISSESAVMTPPDMIHYGMTKTAQLAISRGLAETTRGTKVTVNTVLPGPTQSANIEQFLRSVATDPGAPIEEVEKEFFARHRQSSLLQRLIAADEVAHLVAYVASPLSSASNGATFRAEGGLIRSVV